MSCKPTCGNEISLIGESAGGSLLRIWTNIEGRSERFISVLLPSKKWTQFHLGSPMHGMIPLQQTKNTILNISREVWHDPQLNPLLSHFPPCVHPPLPPPLLSFVFHSGFSPISWFLFHQSWWWKMTFVSNRFIGGLILVDHRPQIFVQVSLVRSVFMGRMFISWRWMWNAGTHASRFTFKLAAKAKLEIRDVSRDNLNLLMSLQSGTDTKTWQPISLVLPLRPRRWHASDVFSVRHTRLLLQINKGFQDWISEVISSLESRW